MSSKRHKVPTFRPFPQILCGEISTQAECVRTLQNVGTSLAADITVTVEARDLDFVRKRGRCLLLQPLKVQQMLSYSA